MELKEVDELSRGHPASAFGDLLDEFDQFSASFGAFALHSLSATEKFDAIDT